MANVRRLLAAVLLLGLLFTTWPADSLAATKTAVSNAVSLSPFLQNITVSPSDTTKTFDLQLSNNSPNVQEFDLTSRDFGSLNSSGGVLLEGTSNSDYAEHYGLTSWLTLEVDTVVLQPGESRAVTVSINNRQDLQPGGHYGAVVASVKSPDQQSGNHVSVNQQLLSLILVDKQGGDHFDLKLQSVEQNGNWLHLPNDIHLRFQNPGNVHVTPRGVVLLKNPAGRVVAQGVINSQSAFILPASFRDLYVRLTPVGRQLPLPGVYHVEVDYRYDGLSQSAKRTLGLHFVNLKLYIGLILMIGGLSWLIKRRFWHPKNHSETGPRTDEKTT